MRDVGVIGLGSLGAPMCRRFAGAGYRVIACDLDERARAALDDLELVTTTADASAVAKGAEVIVLCLPSAEASRAVSRALMPGRVRIVLETSTVGPLVIRDLARELEVSRIAVLDVPVSGGPARALAGTLSMMMAGAPSLIEEVEPLVALIAQHRFHVGTEVGLAQVCKLVNNSVSAAGMVAACEATVLGVRSGLEAKTMLDAINASSGRNAATEEKFPRSILTGNFDHGGPLGLMVKDLELFVGAAARLDLECAMAKAALGVWKEAVRRTGGDADYCSLIRHLEADAGIEVRARNAASSAQRA